jgi:hypothetical protein
VTEGGLDSSCEVDAPSREEAREGIGGLEFWRAGADSEKALGRKVDSTAGSEGGGGAAETLNFVY